MADSKLGSSLKQASKDLKNAFLEKVCREIDYAAATSINGKIPYGLITKIMNETKDEQPWINRNIISFAYKIFCKRKKSEKPETEADIPSDALPAKSKGGRPKGTTHLLKHHLKESALAAKNEITCMYHEKKKECIQKGEKIPAGWLKETIESVKIMRGLPPSVRIPMSTIRNRTKQIIMQESGSETLMASIEPHLVELICAMGQIRRSLTGSESLSLANDLIYGTEVEHDIIQWKKKRKEYDPDGPVLGKKYW